MAKKQNLIKDQKKMKNARAVSGNGSKGDPYYPTDYKVGKRDPKKDEKPMVEMAKPMTTKQWIGTIIVLMIPLVNLIALIAWANKKNGKVNPSKRSFSRAYLIVWAISLAVSIVLVVVMVVAIIFLFPFPATPSDAVALLEDADYTVNAYEEEEAKILSANENVDCFIIAKDGENTVLYMYFFDTEENAETYYNTIRDEMAKEYDIVGMHSKVVFFGEEKAVSSINGDFII